MQAKSIYDVIMVGGGVMTLRAFGRQSRISGLPDDRLGNAGAGLGGEGRVRGGAGLIEPVGERVQDVAHLGQVLLVPAAGGAQHKVPAQRKPLADREPAIHAFGDQLRGLATGHGRHSPSFVDKPNQFCSRHRRRADLAR